MIGVVEGELMSIVDELLSSGCGGGQRMHLQVYETTYSFTRNPRTGYTCACTDILKYEAGTEPILLLLLSINMSAHYRSHHPRSLLSSEHTSLSSIITISTVLPDLFSHVCSHDQ